MTYITCKSCWDKTGLMNAIIEKYIKKREILGSKNEETKKQIRQNQCSSQYSRLMNWLLH